MTPDFLYNIAAALIVGGALWGGIRADIKGMHESIAAAFSEAKRANDRIDNHIDRRFSE